MTRNNRSLVLKFKMAHRLPSLSDMEGYVPGFVDSFFERGATRVNKNATEIWVKVGDANYDTIVESLKRMQTRLDTPRDELKYYESTLALSSDDVEFEFMTHDDYSAQTEHSASIANEDWTNVTFKVLEADDFYLRLQDVNDDDSVIKVSRRGNQPSEAIPQDVTVGDVVRGNPEKHQGFSSADWVLADANRLNGVKAVA